LPCRAPRRRSPIFQEDHLPENRRIDKASLASADEGQLGSLIQSHIAARQKDVKEARDRLDSKPELIYKLDKLLPQFYVQQNIAPGSIYDMIIQDKMKDDAIMKLIGGIVLAVVAIALAIVSFGTATPAIAAGAAAMGFGLSAYMAYDEYQHYAEDKDMANVGFARDPSVVWLVVVAAAVKAMKSLGPAAKTLGASGDVAEFAKLVKALEAKGEIDAKIARAAEQAAAARRGFVDASGDLAKAMGAKLYSFPGPLTDPDVYRALVRMAKEGFGVVWHESVQFLEHIRKLRVDKGLKDLSPEEIIKVREAWEQARVLKESAKAPVDIVGTSGRTIGKYSNGSFWRSSRPTRRTFYTVATRLHWIRTGRPQSPAPWATPTRWQCAASNFQARHSWARTSAASISCAHPSGRRSRPSTRRSSTRATS
jgi:hypothetical protein